MLFFQGHQIAQKKIFPEVSIFLDNQNKSGPQQYSSMDEVLGLREKIERDKGSKYYINGKEVRARDAQTFFADLSTGAHSPSMISQGKIGQLVISKPVERESYFRGSRRYSRDSC